MANQYVNKVQLADGSSIIDISDTTAVPADVAQGKYFYGADGEKKAGTASGGGAIIIDDTLDSHGGTVRTITAIEISGTKSIDANGTGINVAEYRYVDVNVPSSQPSLQSKTVSVTPSETAYSQATTPDSGYDGLSSVQVNVGAISSTYVGSGITRRSSTDLTASGATVTVPSGYYSSQASKAVSNGSATPASTISATGATVSTGTNTLTLSKSVANTPQVTAGYVSSGTQGNSSVSLTASITTQAAQTIYPSTSDQTISSGRYLTGTQTIKGVAVSSNLTADNIKSGVTVTIGDSADADRIKSVTGTYSGGGGSSKNAQVAQSTTRSTSSTYTECVSLTCSKTGTYHVYWSTFRSSTSGTWGSQLYINDAAYGTAQTGSWSNHIQNIHLTSVSLTADDEVAVRVRTRGNSYYGYVGTLTIIEA